VLDITKSAKDFLDNLPSKQFKQITSRIFELNSNPKPHDYKHLSGHPSCFRIDSGEYRICYKISNNIVYIIVIGQRNDDQVYKKLNRIC